MIITPIKTRKFLPPKDRLDDLITAILPHLEENSIVAITSKVISICEGNTIPESEVKDKDALIIQQADQYLSRDLVPGRWTMHTLKNNILIPTAGIDQSNANGHYILWPKNPQQSAQNILKTLKEKSKLTNLGAVITDSHSVPLRRGTIGISLAFAGFNPLYDYRGQKDLFDRDLVMTQTNIPDSLAAAAVLAMGEGNEQTPAALITNLPKTINFLQNPPSDKPFASFEVPLDEDLFRPFLISVPWKKR